MEKAIDLFCGCGGLTTGLKEAGFKVFAAVDNNKTAIETYKINHPEVKTLMADIKNIDPDILLTALNIKPGELDLLAGCPPCQGFSSLRTLNGKKKITDPRNDLIFSFLHFAKAFRPKAIMLENVPGLKNDKRFHIFRKSLEELGYIGSFDIFNAADFGVPQNRKRLIYAAGHGFAITLAPPFPSRKTVREAIGKLPKAGYSGDPLHDLPEHRTPKTKELIKMIPKDGGSRTDLPHNYQLKCHKNFNGFKDVYGRMAWDLPAPTITTGCFNPSKGRFLHPEENRAITMREAALLQGFPSDYKFPCHIGKTAIAAMIGNALPPPFITAHALHIKNCILKHKPSTITSF